MGPRDGTHHGGGVANRKVGSMHVQDFLQRKQCRRDGACIHRGAAIGGAGAGLTPQLALLGYRGQYLDVGGLVGARPRRQVRDLGALLRRLRPARALDSQRAAAANGAHDGAASGHCVGAHGTTGGVKSGCLGCPVSSAGLTSSWRVRTRAKRRDTLYANGRTAGQVLFCTSAAAPHNANRIDLIQWGDRGGWSGVSLASAMHTRTVQYGAVASRTIALTAA